jgi:hypothetical protein
VTVVHELPGPVGSSSAQWIGAASAEEGRRLARQAAAERQRAGIAVVMGYPDEAGVMVELWMRGMSAPMSFVQRMQGSTRVGAPIAGGFCSWENPHTDAGP